MGRGAEQIKWPIHLEVIPYLDRWNWESLMVVHQHILSCDNLSWCIQDIIVKETEVHFISITYWWHSALNTKHTCIWNWQVSRVTVRAKEAVEAAGGSVRRVYYNKLGFRALLKPEWFEKKGRLLPKAARPPPKQRDKVDSIGRLPAPTKPIPFSVEERGATSGSSA